MSQISYWQITQAVKHALTTLGLCLILSACGDGDGDPVANGINGVGGNGGNNQPNDGTPTTPGSPADSGDCTYVLTSDITSPTQLINTPQYCDYALDGWVEINSLLSIEPGVVVRAGPDARLVLDGGEIRAIGSAQNRIVLEGASHVQGYWRGIDIRSGRASVFDYVDIKDAGQVCSIIFCPDVGFFVDNISFSFTNSTVSNSYVIGMSITEDVDLQAFANNQFYGNALYGLAVHNENIPLLDTNSDYRGIGNENGIVGVGVHSGSQTKGEIFQWKKLNAPYLINSYFNVEGGILRLDPGVEIQFDAEAWMTVEGNGVFQALGTAAEPITISGQRAQPGYWDGIRYTDSPWDNNILQYVTISHSGNTEGLISAYAAINLDESRILIRNSQISDNSRWGIVCNDPDFPDVPSVIEDGGGNTFFNNASGHVDADCSVE